MVRDLLRNPSCHHVRAKADDEMEMIPHDRISQQINPQMAKPPSKATAEQRFAITTVEQSLTTNTSPLLWVSFIVVGSRGFGRENRSRNE